MKGKGGNSYDFSYIVLFVDFDALPVGGPAANSEIDSSKLMVVIDIAIWKFGYCTKQNP